MEKFFKNLIIHDVYNKIIPDFLRERIDIYRRRKVYQQKKIIFIHVPKAAGTSICHALYGKTLGHFKAKDVQKILPNEFKTCFKFALVRNPYDRVISAYKFAKQGGTDVMGIAHAKKYQTACFNSFEDYVIKWLPSVDLSTEDYVFQPQYLFTHGKNFEQLVDQIWKVEDMPQFYDGFYKQTQLKLPQKHINQSKNNSSEEFIFTEEMQQVVRQCYKNDFKLLGYPE